MRARVVLPCLTVAVVGLSGCGGGSSSSAAVESSAVRASNLAAVAAENSSPAVAAKGVSQSSANRSSAAVKPAAPALVDAQGNPIIPAAARAHTDAGAIAFTKYYIALLDASDANPSLFKRVPLAASICPSCKQLNALLQEQQGKNIHLLGNGTVLTGFNVETSPDKTQKIVGFLQKKSPCIKVEGSSKTAIGGGRFQTRLLLIWENGGWKIGQMGSDPA